MSEATMRWWREFREMERIRPIVDAALAASDGELRKRFGLPPASGMDAAAGGRDRDGLDPKDDSPAHVVGTP